MVLALSVDGDSIINSFDAAHVLTLPLWRPLLPRECRPYQWRTRSPAKDLPAAEALTDGLAHLCQLLRREPSPLPIRPHRRSFGLHLVRKVRRVGKRGVTLQEMFTANDFIFFSAGVGQAAEIHPITVFSRDEQNWPSVVKHVRTNERCLFAGAHFPSHSSGVFAPLLRLHVRQLGSRFCGEVGPPREYGTR